MTSIFFNEIHYDNKGFDQKKEGVEIAGPAGTSLDNWKVVCYNGLGKAYREAPLSGAIPNQKNGFGTLWFFIKSLNNGVGPSGDGLALIDPNGKVVQFLSYGGKEGFSISATEGAAKGATSTRLPVNESHLTPLGYSLQLQGKGSVYEDFKWVGPIPSTYGKLNTGQDFIAKASNTTTPSSGSTSSSGNTTTTTTTSSGPGTFTVDLNLDKNRTLHKTDKFHTTDMFVVRRGFPFTVTLSSKDIDLTNLSSMSVTLTYTPEGNSTKLEVSPNTVDEAIIEDWYAYSDSPSKATATVTIGVPSKATVGRYYLTVNVGKASYKTKDPLIILFNPWAFNDLVYMPESSLLEEYILNDEGFIWVGSANSNTGRAWNFGQFNTSSLNASLNLLERCPFKDRGNPIMVSRHMSALVNSNDDSGVLSGNWSGNYSGGQSPTSWTGSAEILKQYLTTGKPVKYGQCWVFSGVLTTVMRSLGVPARSVTNFESAHDTSKPFNRAVDKYFKKNMEPDEDQTSDSVWNFHVWNDVWMSRPDLDDYNLAGWQAIDATPQELSEEVFQTGPVPVEAIKNGKKDAVYDGEFVYSEVNADIRYLVEQADGSYKTVRTITDGVGKNMSTKMPGQNARQDVTLEYKYAEGSSAERAAFNTGGATSNDQFDVTLQVDQATVGQDVTAKLVIKRKDSRSTVNVSVAFVAGINMYTGRNATANLKEINQRISLSSDAPQMITMTVSVKDYLPYLGREHAMLFRAMLQNLDVADNSDLVFDSFHFTPSHLTMELTEPAGKSFKKGSNGKVTINFKNPLPITLTNLVLNVEGQSFTKKQSFKFASLEAGKELKQTVDITAWQSGKKIIQAELDAKELINIHGYKEIDVSP